MIETDDGKATYTGPAATRDEDSEFHRLAEQAARARPAKKRRSTIRVIEPDHIATDCWATWSGQDGRRVLVITCNEREVQQPRR